MIPASLRSFEGLPLAPAGEVDFVGRVRSDQNQRPIDTRADDAGSEGRRRFEDSRDVARGWQ